MINQSVRSFLVPLCESKTRQNEQIVIFKILYFVHNKHIENCNFGHWLGACVSVVPAMGGGECCDEKKNHS